MSIVSINKPWHCNYVIWLIVRLKLYESSSSIFSVFTGLNFNTLVSIFTQQCCCRAKQRHQSSSTYLDISGVIPVGSIALDFPCWFSERRILLVWLMSERHTNIQLYRYSAGSELCLATIPCGISEQQINYSYNSYRIL